MKQIKLTKIFNYFDELYPDAKCELNYQKDYELLISVMLSAQTTDVRVNQVTSILYEKYPTLEKLQSANPEDIINIIRPIGTFRIKTSNIINIVTSLINDQNGIVPNDRIYLESLPGVGRKTANVVLSELFNKPVLAVDTHVKRVSIRLGLVNENDSVLVIEKKLTNLIPTNKINKFHHQMIFFGRYHCKAKKPNCSKCKLSNICNYYNKKTE